MQRTFLGTVAAICLLSCTPTVSGQSGAKNGEWRTYGGDLGNTHYSPLDQINADNFSKLQVAWRFKTDNLGPRPELNFEGTPLMVGGVIYSTAGTRRAVVALDAATGELLWVHGEHEGARGTAAPRQLSGRGLAYWTDGREERILYVTPGYRLVALDAKTGNLVPSFGNAGLVDLKLDDDQEIDLVTGEVGLHAAPVVANDVVIVGAAHRPGGVVKSKTNVKGFVRGFDVRTGKRLWIFHTIPQSTEFGYDTWEKDSASYTGNAGVWGQISVDEQLGMAYIPVELPTGDYYGGHRPGNGLFGETVLAVDLKTGQRKWHYQLVHHGIWDMDIPCAPMLVDITVNGRPIRALAQPTKQAFLYVFDRVTGQPVWPIEEKPVEQTTVPGEKTSPTQPFPSKPPAYDLQGFSTDDVVAFTPELKAEALKVVSKYKLGPVFTPPVVSKPEGPYATLALGTAGGGTNWAGGSYDPETHIAYLPSQRTISSLGLIPGDPSRTDMMFMQGSAALGKTALWKHQRHRFGQGADPVADRERRHAGQHPHQPRAQGTRYSPHRKGWRFWSSGDQDAGHLRRAKRREIARDAPRLRQGHWQRSRRGSHARRSDRYPNDIHAQRAAIHCRGDCGPGIPGRIDRFQSAGRRAQELSTPSSRVRLFRH